MTITGMMVLNEAAAQHDDDAADHVEMAGDQDVAQHQHPSRLQSRRAVRRSGLPSSRRPARRSHRQQRSDSTSDVATIGATEVTESLSRKASVSRNTPSPEKPSRKPQISSRCGIGRRKAAPVVGSLCSGGSISAATDGEQGERAQHQEHVARPDLEHQQRAADEAARLDDADHAAARADPLAGVGAVGHGIGQRAEIERGEGDAPQDAGGDLQPSPPSSP
jgi:hypothetical protein